MEGGGASLSFNCVTEIERIRAYRCAKGLAKLLHKLDHLDHCTILP